MRTTAVSSLSVMAVVLALGGCGGSSGTQSGTLNLAVSDTPVDGATHVTLAFTSVTLQNNSMSDNMDMMMMDDMGMADVAQSGNTITINFAKERRVDLLQQQDGRSAKVLGGLSVPVGSYTSATFAVDPDQSTIALADGSVHPLVVSSDGISANGSFVVTAAGASNITVDFDLREAISLEAGVYTLRPALRAIDDMQAGRISGSAPNTAIIGGKAISDPTCVPAAYIYSGANVTPAGLSVNGPVQPVATATLKLDNDSGDYRYTAAFLPAGVYTVAFICAGMDEAHSAYSLTPPQRAQVTARTTSAVNLP